MKCLLPRCLHGRPHGPNWEPPWAPRCTPGGPWGRPWPPKGAPGALLLKTKVCDMGSEKFPKIKKQGLESILGHFRVLAEQVLICDMDLMPACICKSPHRCWRVKPHELEWTILEWGGDARTRDEYQARGAGRAGPACPPCVRACVRHTSKRVQKWSRIIKIPLGFSLKVKM